MLQFKYNCWGEFSDPSYTFIYSSNFGTIPSIAAPRITTAISRTAFKKTGHFSLYFCTNFVPFPKSKILLNEHRALQSCWMREIGIKSFCLIILTINKPYFSPELKKVTHAAVFITMVTIAGHSLWPLTWAKQRSPISGGVRFFLTTNAFLEFILRGLEFIHENSNVNNTNHKHMIKISGQWNLHFSSVGLFSRLFLPT